MCEIQGISIPNLQNRTLYMPLSHCGHPQATGIIEYCPEKLLLHLHASFMVQAKAVVSVCTEMQQEELAKVSGIKGIPLSVLLGP